MFDWAYSGVNQSVPRNAGPDCAYYLTPTRRHLETVIILMVAYGLTTWGYARLTLASRYDPGDHRQLPSRRVQVRDRATKKALLMLMSLIWGMEIGYKFSSRTVIYLLNPCHITTAIQIYLLASAPSELVTAVFRIHLNFLNGPLLAFLFPETDSRILPLEAAIYWIQHGMMFVVPYYLLRIGGVYHTEDLTDYSWNAFSFGLNIVYHFIILQAIAVPSQVNLNHMLCPAILDPFSGPYYRTIAVMHQAILCPAICKLFCFLSYKVIAALEPTSPSSSTTSSKVALATPESRPVETVNGHSHTD